MNILANTKPRHWGIIVHIRPPLLTTVTNLSLSSYSSQILHYHITHHHNTIIINGDIGALNCCEWLLAFHCHHINNCHKKSFLQSSSCNVIITFPSPTTMTIWYLRDTIVVFVEFIQAGRLVGYPLPNLSCVAQYHSIKWETRAGLARWSPGRPLLQFPSQSYPGAKSYYLVTTSKLVLPRPFELVTRADMGQLLQRFPAACKL